MGTFSDSIKKARLKSGYSQKDVANAVGVAKSTYSLYESGKREPNVDTIKKIASFLNTSGDILLGIEDSDITTEKQNNDIKLLDLYRQLNGEGQQRVIDYTEDLVSSSRYSEKNDHSEMVGKDA